MNCYYNISDQQNNHYVSLRPFHFKDWRTYLRLHSNLKNLSLKCQRQIRQTRLILVLNIKLQRPLGGIHITKPALLISSKL